MRAARAGQASRAHGRARTGAVPAAEKGPRLYTHYPRYPQADSAWTDSDSVTASGCGRDDLPATEESLPSHSPGGCLVPSSDGDRLKRTAGRLTKPQRSGRGRACPSANAKAAGFDQRPSEPGPSSDGKGTGPGPTAFGPAERSGRTPDLRIQDQPGGKRCLRTGALPPARTELRLPIGRAGPGFGPGAANQAWTRGLGSWPCQAEPEASAEDPAGGEFTGFGP
jgi:hypothetical protein